MREIAVVGRVKWLKKSEYVSPFAPNTVTLALAAPGHIRHSRNREGLRGCHVAARPTERNTSRQGSTRNDTFTHNGNQTRIETSTGIWLATYNALNRPVRFESADGSTVITADYDYMGRRVFKKVASVNAGTAATTSHLRFLYRSYLQIAALDLTRPTLNPMWFITWESPRGHGGGLENARSGIAPKGRAGNGVPASQPTQDTATRPLAIQKDRTWYTYGWDLTKNICEVFGQAGYVRTAYTYTPYGAVTADGDVQQPIQWSSEVWNSELAIVYYNYRYYNAVDGKWIQRDFPEETVGFNLYSYVLNTPVNSSDYIGLWEIRRSSQSATAEAIAECGDTWKVLAESVGLLVTEAAHWVGGYTTFPRKGRTYTVPNTIISYWVGDVGGVGRWWVDWDYNNKAFEKANYHVKKYIANVSTKYANILNAESKGKTLLGTYYWGHGVYNTKTNRVVALLERDEYNYSYFNDFDLLYHMQFAFIFACDSIQGKNALKSIHYRGFEGVLVPWNPWRPIYAEPSDYVE